ncbi:MAG: TolC family protein, partial [Planctomycetales bacterium]|nr:TolC family protein [Planctomycetales bacterium]
WYALIEAHAQLELLEKQTETNRNGLKAVELRFEFGGGGSANVLRQRQLIQSTLEQMVVVRSSIEVLEHQLAVLTGQPPQNAAYSPGSLLPELPPLPYSGLPSQLLQRRPDVQADFLAMAAADRDLAAAVLDQYPRLNLASSLVNAAENPATLFRDWFLSVGGQLIGPILDGGQRRAEVSRRQAIVCQRFNEYRQTILIALQEVEDGLALERFQVERIGKLQTQVELAEQASELLEKQFITGDASYLDILSAVQSQQRLQRAMLSARLDLILIRIGLYLALAGDFDTRVDTNLDLLSDFSQLSSNLPGPASGGQLPSVEPQAFESLPEEVESDLPSPQRYPSRMFQLPMKSINNE